MSVALYGTAALEKMSVPEIFSNAKRAIQVVRECFQYGLDKPDNPLHYLMMHDNRSIHDKRRSITYLYTFRRLMITPLTRGSRLVFAYIINLFDGHGAQEIIAYLQSLEADRERIQQFLHRYQTLEELKETLFYMTIKWINYLAEYGESRGKWFVEFELWVSASMAHMWQIRLIYSDVLGKQREVPDTGLRTKYLQWRAEKQVHTAKEAELFVSGMWKRNPEYEVLINGLQAMYDLGGP